MKYVSKKVAIIGGMMCTVGTVLELEESEAARYVDEEFLEPEEVEVVLVAPEPEEVEVLLVPQDPTPKEKPTKGK